MLAAHRRKKIVSSTGPLRVPTQTTSQEPVKMKHQSHHHHQTSTPVDILPDKRVANERRRDQRPSTNFRWAAKFSLTTLVLVAVFLAQIEPSQASIWPFGAGSSHKSSSSSSSSESSKREVHSPANGAPQSAGSGAVPPTPPATLSQQFHYFWNHDKMEPRLVAQEASRILSDVQLQTNHKAMLALSGARRSSDGASSSSSAGGASQDSVSSSESALEPVAALGPSALQQLTGLVLQMQRQLQQHQTSLLAQPRLDMQSRLMQAAGPIPLAAPPAAPMGNRFWTPQMAHVMSSTKLLPAESIQMPSTHPLMHPLAAAALQPMSQVTLPGTSFAGVPVYGPYAIQAAPSLIRPSMIRATRSMNLVTPTAGSAAHHNNQAKGSRRKTWPSFHPFTDHRIPFFMSSAASQPKVTVVGPPATYSASHRSSLMNTRTPSSGVQDKQTLLEATSSQLAAAISSHLQARAAQQKLVSLLSQVIEQPASKHHTTKDHLLGASSFTSARFAQPEEATGSIAYLMPSTLMNSANQIEFPSAQPLPSSMIMDLNNSSSAFGNRLNRRQLNSYTSDNYTMNSNATLTQNELDTLSGSFKSGNSSRVDMLLVESSSSSPRTRVKRSSTGWNPSGFMPMVEGDSKQQQQASSPVLSPATKMPRQARFLRASPSTSLTSGAFSPPLLLRRNLANSTAAGPQEHMTTVSSLQIPESALDWSTPTKRSQLFKGPKVKRLVSSASVMHQSMQFPAKASGSESAPASSVLSAEQSKSFSALHSGPLQPVMSPFKPQEDIMSASAAESARVINYFQNVDSSSVVDRTSTTKGPELASDTLRPVSSGQSALMDFSSTVNRYKTSSQRKSAANETSSNDNSPGSHYISGSRGNGLQALSGANYVPHHSAPASSSGGLMRAPQAARQQVSSVANNGATPDISSSASRSVVYSVNSNSGATSGELAPIANKPGQLETSSSKIGSGNHALVGSITRASASNSNHQLMQQLDSSLSDLDGQDMQLKLLDSLIAKEHSGRSSSASAYVTTQQPPQMAHSQQQEQSSFQQQQQLVGTGTGNDRSPSADQSGSYNEEMLPPSFGGGGGGGGGSQLGNDQSFQDALVDHQSSMGGAFGDSLNQQQDLKQSSMESGLSESPSSRLQQSAAMQQSLAQVQSQQTYNMTPGEWISGPSAVTVEQPMEISSNSFQNLNQGFPQEDQSSQYYPAQSYPMLNGATNNPLLYQPSIQQRQFYAQQLHALGSAVNRYNNNNNNQNRFNNYQQQSSFASSRNQSPKEMYAPMLRNDFNHLNWPTLDESQLLHQSAIIPQSVQPYANQNYASLMNFAGGPNVNDPRNYLMAGSEQSRSGQGYETQGSTKSKVAKSKPIKQVSHHYHINNFGFPVEDVDNPLDIASAFATNPGLSYPMNHQQQQQKPAKPAKSHKQEEEKQNEEQEEEEEKPKKKKFLRRFSIKNLFKKLKKDKKKENVDQGSDEETGSGGGGSGGGAEENSDERRSRLY